ncbi:DUF362 domain-containing protein [Desulfosoma sp.]|uniref:DUF362 domain-containing protein n=1 Tax=Desulfosoma sp. TaxID=2603217 RepID=UPI00404AFBC0
MENHLEPSVTYPPRRRFLLCALRYGLGLGALWALGLSLRDGIGPKVTITKDNALVGPWDWSISHAPKAVAVVTGLDRAACFAAGVAALGGIKTFVSSGDRVFIKVNAAFASPPSLGATSHPDLVQAVVRHCREAGASRVIVSDNPINDPASCFRLTGIAEAVQLGGGELWVPESRRFQPVTLPDGRYLHQWPAWAAPFRKADKVINLAPVKHHHRAGASMICKNWYGLLGGPRNLLHQNVHVVIGELAALFRPTLVVLDGITAMMTNGPTGGSLADVKEARTLIISPDPVAADALGARILNIDPHKLPYLHHAQRLGAGSLNLDAIALHHISV